MVRYFLRRLVYSLLTIVLIASATFIMMHSIPGGPFTRERPVPDEIMRRLNEKYNLDAPLHTSRLYVNPSALAPCVLESVVEQIEDNP